MSYIYRPSFFSYYLNRIILYLFLIITFSIIQSHFSFLFGIDGVIPDFLIILCVWIALYENRVNGIIFGFIAGICFDLISYEYLGSNAVIKAIVGFIAGSFYYEENPYRNLVGFRFILITFLASIVNFALYYMINMDIREFTVKLFVYYNLIASSVYTCVFSLIPMFFAGRAYSR